MKLLTLCCSAILMSNSTLAETPVQDEQTPVWVSNNDQVTPNLTGGPFIVRIWDETIRYAQEGPTVIVCGETSGVRMLDDGLPPDPTANDHQYTGSAVACVDGVTPIVVNGPNGESIFETVIDITSDLQSPSLNIHVSADSTTGALVSDGPSEPSASIAAYSNLNDVEPAGTNPVDNIETARSNIVASNQEVVLSDSTTDKILALFYLSLGLIIGGFIGWKADKSKVS